MLFTRFTTLVSLVALIGFTTAVSVEHRTPCADICTNPPPSCADEPDLCCCVREPVTVPSNPTPTKSCSSLIGKPTGICADVCFDPPPRCSEQPDLCCCVPDVVVTTCAPQYIAA